MNITKAGRKCSKVMLSQLNDGDCFIEINGKDDAVYMKSTSFEYDRKSDKYQNVIVKIDVSDGYISGVYNDYMVTPIICDLTYYEV